MEARFQVAFLPFAILPILILALLLAVPPRLLPNHCRYRQHWSGSAQTRNCGYGKFCHHLGSKHPLTTWQLSTPSCCVTSIAQLPNGVHVCTGTDNRIYQRAGLGSSWVLFTSSQLLTFITTFKDGSVVGIGTDKKVYVLQGTTWALTSPADGCCVKSITQMADGTIVGVGTDNALWTTTRLGGVWHGHVYCCNANLNVCPAVRIYEHYSASSAVTSETSVGNLP